MAWLVKDKIKENYLACCKEAVLSDTAFNRFKKDKRYTPITEHLDRDIGQAYLDKIIEKNEYIFNVKKKRFLRNDLYGQPKRYDYGKYGVWSPTTLRYIYVAFELKKYFNGLDCMDIVEIGGGYGGQCKIINDMRGFKSYKIIDLKEPYELTRKYLQLFSINLEEKNKEKYDLCIANYSFSELNKTEQDNYINSILLKSYRGYMVYNNTKGNYSVKEIIQKLQCSAMSLHEDIPCSRSEVIIWQR